MDPAVKGLRVTESADGCTFTVHVVPRSQQDTVAGLHGDALKLRLQAPPAEGKANRALQRFLAQRLGVTMEAVEVLAGHASRRKVCLLYTSPSPRDS